MIEETPAQLVAHLSDANGWWRDTAQQLLVQRNDKSVVPALKQLAISAPDCAHPRPGDLDPVRHGLAGCRNRDPRAG